MSSLLNSLSSSGKETETEGEDRGRRRRSGPVLVWREGLSAGEPGGGGSFNLGRPRAQPADGGGRGGVCGQTFSWHSQSS